MRRRSLSSSLAALSLSLSVWAASCVFPVGRVSAAASCPIEPPSPLRTLYRQSERIVVARVSESARVRGEDRENMRKTALDVTESLKGDPGEKRLYVYHYVWDDDPTSVSNVRKGETLLLFLTRGQNEDDDGYYVTDMRHGLKRLSEADLKVYVKRIDELAWLTRQDPPDQKELLEWLVRCAEEPATRWEGAYELSVAYNLLDAQEAKSRQQPDGESPDEADDEGEADDDAEELEESAGAASGEDSAAGSGETSSDAAASAEGAAETEAAGVEEEVTVADEAANAESEEVVETDPRDIVMAVHGTDVDASLVALLTEEQKSRLSGALFDVDDKLGEGDMPLIEVVRHWDESRLVPFLVRHLRLLEDDPPYEAEQMVHAVAHVLKDRKITRLAEKYTENAIYGDDAGEEESEEGGEGAEARSVKVGAEPAPPKPTSAQKRGEMLRRFLARVEDRLNELGAEAAQR